MGFYDAIRVGASVAADDVVIDRSLRFTKASNSQLNRTGTSTSSSYTVSVWFKYCAVGNNTLDVLFSLGQANDGNSAFMGINNNNQFVIYNNGGYQYTSTSVYRDPSAWYHFTMSVNSNSYTAYINNVSIDTGTLRSLDTTSNGLRVGVQYGNYYPWDGYLADFYLIDGSALTPSSFTKTNVETGQLIPKKYSGSFGTSGAHLTFSDNSGTTATTLGKDSSGNGNNFTPSNFSVSAGVDNDSLEDTPTNNFCTLNPLDKSNNASLRAGALTLYTNSNDQAAVGTFAVKSGKWYWEVDKNDAEPEIGIAHHNMPLSNKTVSLPSDGQISFIVAGADGNSNFLRVDGNTQTGTGMSAQTGTGSIGIALDMDNKKIWWSDLSGNYFNSGNPVTGANAQVDFSSTGPNYPTGFVTPFVSMYQGANKTVSINFGQRPFTHTQPTGYKTLNSANLPDPTILLPNKHFDTTIYTGNETARSFSLDFGADWIWIKERSAGGSHRLFDSVRGANNVLISSQTTEELVRNDEVPSFSSTGFNIGDAATVNENSVTNVAWTWNAGDTDSATYTVKVVSDSGNKYRFNNFGTSAVTLDLAEGGTYTFDGSDSSMSGHPFVIGTAANGTVYSTGVTYQLDGVSVTYSAYTSGYASASTRKLIITVPASAPVLYYWCSIHSGMGGQINTNSTLGSSNFDGSIQSRAKVNASAGFSIVTYTGNHTSGATVGHGLGVAPKVVIVKARGTINSQNRGWGVYHAELGNTKYVQLNTNAASATNSAWWNNTTPNSTTFTLGNDYDVNADISGGNYVTYVFSEVAGYSKFGKYSGNGSSNGPFVNLGFKPAFIIIKRTNASEGWHLFDNKRDPDNPIEDRLEADSNGASFTGYDWLDILSNGFKTRVGVANTNASGSTYIYFAWAESPFKNSRAR